VIEKKESWKKKKRKKGYFDAAVPTRKGDQWATGARLPHRHERYGESEKKGWGGNWISVKERLRAKQKGQRPWNARVKKKTTSGKPASPVRSQTFSHLEC